MIYEYYNTIKDKRECHCQFSRYILNLNTNIIDINEMSNDREMAEVARICCILLEQGSALKRVSGWKYEVINRTLLLDLLNKVETIFEYEYEKEDLGIADYKLILNIPLSDRPSSHYGFILTKYEKIYDSILALLREAEKEIVILTPFLDKSGFKMIENILLEKMKSRVKVSLITRYSGCNNLATKQVVDSFIFYIMNKSPQCLSYFEVFNYYYRDRNNVPYKFHAKGVLIDEGRKCYVGSANITQNSLTDLFELGVILQDRQSQDIYRLILAYLKNEGFLNKQDFSYLQVSENGNKAR